MSPLKVIAISDTHNRHEKIEIPKCDILIHCGDMTSRGTRSEVLDFLAWFVEQPAGTLILTAGNHDWLIEKEVVLARSFLSNFGFNELGIDRYYLQDNLITVAGLRIYGSPYSPFFHNWAFNLHRGPEIARKWAFIPDNVDILCTHGPPYGFGDQVLSGEKVGCADLLRRIEQIEPRFHLFGHVHEAKGIYTHPKLKTKFINCSICNEHYQPINKPTILEI